MREADRRRLAELRAANHNLTEGELQEYADLLARVPDKIRTHIVVSRAD